MALPSRRPSTPFRLKIEQAPNRSLGAEEEPERSLTGAEQESLIITIVFGYFDKKIVEFRIFSSKNEKTTCFGRQSESKRLKS